VVPIFGLPQLTLAPKGAQDYLDSRDGTSIENEIYVAELLNWRVQKLILQGDGSSN
jgi:hypothetical protein